MMWTDARWREQIAREVSWERAAIVRYMHRLAELSDKVDDCDANTLRRAAKEIARGDHLISFGGVNGSEDK